MTADDYVNQVINTLPRVTPLRAQIALELRGLIADRLEHGQPIEEAVAQLGDPEALANSYLAAVPLTTPSIGARVMAKVVDVATSLAVTAPLAWLTVNWPAYGGYSAAVAFALVAAMVALPVYTMVAEYLAGCTFGKWALHLQVVRESGARIGLGQALVRQASFLLQIGPFDALFALFTEKQQRVFELASKTRVVRIATN